MRKILALAAIIILVGCATTPASDIAALEASLAAADTGALAYVNLPTCGTVGSGVACKTMATIKTIGLASQSAYMAVKAAEAAKDQTSVAKAQTAVAALQAIVTTVATGN